MNGLVPRTVAMLLGMALIAAGAGVMLGAHWGWGLFCSGVLALLVYHLRHLAMLGRWVSGPSTETVPESSGIWDDVFSKLYRRQRGEIRQRRRFARLLARSQQAGRALPYGVTILDAERQIVWCNDSAEAHFSISMEGDVGQAVTNLVRQPEFAAYINRGDYAEPLELTTARKEELILSIQMVPYVESHHLLLSRDVTQAHKLGIVRRDFVANVSHELRTPLTVLIGFLETVRDLKLDATRSRDYLNLMAEQGRRMQRIIEDLLTLSALESAPQPPGGERIDMAALLAQVRNEAEALSAGRHTISFEAEAGVDLAGNAGEIASAFSNLANNAVRYTPAGGSIRIQWRAVGEGAEFSVADNGIGIDAEHLPRLTERFYRVDRSRSRETGGTGLGLAIAKHALARHQATLAIASEPGKGSRFSVRFPKSRVRAAQPHSVAVDITSAGATFAQDLTPIHQYKT
ncbi:MAG: phosphate regulon sensor histidine kinase PhoR [Betaproteobacteria bacterium RIFCSPLOWO2_02_FULL_62_17]|nr:MAG: phosphate regulon sensor histidine kinase PhoR [Betaproteobacteria bacterium RIFCSPLOWO2_02_FULL_62_17]